MALSQAISELELVDRWRAPLPVDAATVPPDAPVLVAIDGQASIDAVADAREHSRLAPAVFVGIGEPEGPITDILDVVVHPADDARLNALVDNVGAHPRAATALAILLRGSEERALDDGLATESSVYSTLQAGPEFAAWLARRGKPDRRDEPASTVHVERDGDRLVITLARPHVRNALNARMRDELLDALGIARADDTVREVVLAGEGPSFCSGGDLDEFGTFPDPATAHLVRLARSVGRMIASMSDRVIAHLHGACMGSGIELPAFAARVVAAPDTEIGLPEVAMGLVPGAGGTVSLPRRIGRHRTALLALSGTTLDAPTALEWGLVDAIEPR